MSRAPELLLGSSLYTNAVDLWSLGVGIVTVPLFIVVVVTEILLGHPFFISIQNDAEQLVSILNSIFFCELLWNVVLGKPTDDELFHMNIPYNNKRCIAKEEIVCWVGIQSLPELPRLPLEPFFKPFMDPHHLYLSILFFMITESSFLFWKTFFNIILFNDLLLKKFYIPLIFLLNFFVLFFFHTQQ